MLTAGLAFGNERRLFAGNNNAPNADCTLIVPPNPLTAQGLATPYQLMATNPRQGPCNEANAAQSSFVQGAVFDPATGQVSIYNPLVLDAGTQPAVQPVVPQLPANAVVGLWFGTNADNLTLQDTNGSLQQGRCVNGLADSIFGQFASCNGDAFMSTAINAVNAGQLKVAAAGTGTKSGTACPTVRNFSVVDQDQSDNVNTKYLVLANGATAQNTTANRQMLAQQGAVPIANGSDNALLTDFMDVALGCTPMTAPDLADPAQQLTALPLNELQAAATPTNPVALLPLNNPMTMVAAQGFRKRGRNNNDPQQSVDKTNLFRAEVGQPAINQATETPTAYCQNLVQIGQQSIQAQQALTQVVTSPDPAAATNLFTFLAQRLSGSFTDLGCMDLLQMDNPVQLQMQGDVVVGATFAGAAGAQGGNAQQQGGNAQQQGGNAQQQGNQAQQQGNQAQQQGNQVQQQGNQVQQQGNQVQQQSGGRQKKARGGGLFPSNNHF